MLRNLLTAPPPLPCSKTDALPREDPSAGGGKLDPIAAILRQRPSIPNRGNKSGFEANESGSMVERRQREGERRERKTRKSTDKNDTANRGQTAAEEKNKEGVISWPWQALYLACWSDKIPPCLSKSLHVVLLYCEAFSCLIFGVKRLCAALS